MATKVTFDWANLLIIVDNGITELDVQVDLYSDWKEDVMLSDNMKHPPAFRTTGGDPINPSENIGETFFLINGWKIRPHEADHTLTLNGNLFVDPFDNSAFTPTVGAFTVALVFKVSSLVTGIKTVAEEVTLCRKFETNRMETDPVGSTITLYDDDDSVLLSGALWQNVGATIGYQGQGAERRDKMT